MPRRRDDEESIRRQRGANRPDTVPPISSIPPADARPTVRDSSTDPAGWGRTIRNARRDLLPQQTTGDMSAMIGGSLQALGGLGSTGNLATNAVSRGAGFLRQSRDAGRGVIDATARRVGITTPGVQGARTPGVVGLSNREVQRQVAGTTAREAGRTGLSTTLVGGTVAGVGAGAVGAFGREDDRTVPDRAGDRTLAGQRSTVQQNEEPTTEEPVTSSGGTLTEDGPLGIRDARRGQSGEPVFDDAFMARYQPSNPIQAVPAGTTPPGFGGGGRGGDDFLQSQAGMIGGSLRGLSPQDRATIMRERERQARFDAGDLTAARPGDLRRMREAFGANTEMELGRSLRDPRGRFSEMNRQMDMTPEDRQREAAMMQAARAQDAQALQQGFNTQQDRLRADRDFREGQFQSDREFALRAQPEQQPPRTLAERFDPETTARIATGLRSDIQSMFGTELSEQQTQQLVGDFQNFIQREASALSEAFGIPADSEFLADNMQPLMDLFAAGMGASMISAGSAADAEGFRAFFRNVGAPAGGRGTRQQRGIFNPDNAAETATNIRQLAEGLLAARGEGGDADRSIRRRGGRINEVAIGDPNNPTQVIRIDDIPEQAQLRIIRAYNQIMGRQRG